MTIIVIVLLSLLLLVAVQTTTEERLYMNKSKAQAFVSLHSQNSS